MPLKLQIKRGSESQVLAGSLSIGELAYATDTKQVFTFDGLTKVQVGRATVDLLEYRPNPGITGRWFYASDTGSLYLDVGSAWIDFNIIDNKISGVAGENLVQYDVVYCDEDDSYTYKKSINNDGSKKAYAVGIVNASGGILLGQVGEIVLCGRIVNDSWSWIPGRALYVSQVSGQITQVEPDGLNSYVRPLGEAISSTEMWFDPKTGWKVSLSSTFVGPTGPTGSQGSQGLIGQEGPTGPMGNQGSQGTQGFQGPQGNVGIDGPMGNQGSQGTQGFQGPQGDVGSTGPTGPMGNQGSQGTQGFQGSPGSISVGGITGSIQFNDGSSLSGSSNLTWEALTQKLGLLGFLDLEVIATPDTPSLDHARMYLVASGTSPNRTVALMVKFSDGSDVELASVVV